MIDLARAATDRRRQQSGATLPPDNAAPITRFQTIRWRDSGMHLASEEWTPIAGVRARSVASAMEVMTVGLLVYEDDDVVVLGLSIDEPGDAVFGAQVIWKAAIIERRVLAHQPDVLEIA